MTSRTPHFALTLSASMMCIAFSWGIWQWGLDPAFSSGSISEIILYGTMLVFSGAVSLLIAAVTIYYGVRVVIQWRYPGLIEGISR